ncbi:energy-coupling factor transporter transmembrane component T family protein [Microbacterium indicum]|uniref:energy-coupling factor transporter transmembrane component T family protein n=1 Tax=Microbacterium indicum TaxID=358100 RepID=UPI00040720B2|nr:energy-coupling factor transporter transmembrane protein EcfT [Microbacterium indicum]
MIALHRPGTSPLHRLPAGAKLAGLAVLALAVSLWPHTAWTAAGSLAATVALFGLGGFAPVVWARQVWSMKWLVAILVASQLLFLGAVPALIGTTRVVAVILLAALVTLTTPVGAMIDAIEALLRRVPGIDAWRVSFTVSLTIAAIPVVAGLAAQIREASRARGVRLGVRSVVTLLVLALRHADEVGDALTARGVL